MWIISGGKQQPKSCIQNCSCSSFGSWCDLVLTSSSGLFSSNTGISDITPFNYFILSLVFLLHMPFVNYVLLKLLYGNALGKLSSLPYLGVALGGGAGRRVLWDWIHLCSFELSATAAQPVPLEGLHRMVKAEAGLEVLSKAVCGGEKGFPEHLFLHWVPLRVWNWGGKGNEP